MFNQVGAKIQLVAKVVCWIGIVVSVLSGVAVIIAGRSVGGVIGGVFTAALGAVLSWTGSLALYGFGQLIEDVHDLTVRRGYAFDDR